MIILSANAGSLTSKNANKLADRILNITQKYEKPDHILIQEFGNDKTQTQTEANFGYSKTYSSKTNQNHNTENDDHLVEIEPEKQRVTKQFTGELTVFPKKLNVFPEIICSLVNLKVSSKRKTRGRKKKDRNVQICLINMYRNHKIGKLKFKSQIERLIKLAREEYGVTEILAIGDTNYPNLTISGALEVSHQGLHVHRLGQAPSNIDKVFATRKLIDLNLSIDVLPTIENTEIDGIGHKTIVVKIDPAKRFSQPAEIELTDESLFERNLRIIFNDSLTKSIIEGIKTWSKNAESTLSNDDLLAAAKNQQLNKEKQKNCNLNLQQNDPKIDPAMAILKNLNDAIQKSKKQVKRKGILQIEDLLDLSEHDTPDKVKQFCRTFKLIKANLLQRSNQVEKIDEGKTPPVADLSDHLQNKLNEGRHTSDEVIKEFSNKAHVSSGSKITPTNITYADIDAALVKIKSTKTPWFLNCSADRLKKAINASGNFKKVVRILIKESFRIGELPESLNIDRVLYLHKKDSVTDPKNYRPISIDNPLCKLCCQIHLTKSIRFLKDFTHTRNFSYSKGKSTITAILTAAYEIEKIIEQGDWPICIFTDMKAAFESIQARLINLLLNCRIVDTKDEMQSKKWIINYLLNKILYGTEKMSEDKIKITRIKTDIGSGQRSKVSPDFWLLQIGSAVFTLELQTEQLKKEITELQEILNLGFADDALSILRMLTERDGRNMEKARDSVTRFMEKWDSIIEKNGMFLNPTKSEILVKKMKNIRRSNQLYVGLGSC